MFSFYRLIRSSRPTRTHTCSTPPAAERLEPRRLLSAVTYHGALDGKIVYLNGGHGFAYDGSVWRTGRGETNEMVEDFGNQDQLRSYADYLLRAGATVVPMRPIGHQTSEVVLDNDSAGVTFTGSWSNSTTTSGFYGTAGDVPYRFASIAATQTAVASYTPTLSAAGFYPVYAWTKDGPDRATDSLYRVNYAGGSAEVTVNHKLVGEGWIYLGTYYFTAGTAGSVQISNKSANASGVVIADAIRFGNGMGSVTRGGATSGRSREDEASLYWLEGQNGVGTSFSQFRGGLTDDQDANVGAPARYAAFMNNAPVGQALYLSFHSNAGGGRGTLGLYNSSANSTPNQQRYAFLLAKEVNADLVAAGSPPLEYAWSNRSDASLTYLNADFDYGEISDNANADEFDATILEVAFHDDASDAALLRDPVTRDRIGRATYQGTVKYYNEFGGATAVMQPAAPTAVRTSVAASGDLTLRWAAPASGAIPGDAATRYVVYVSRNGYGFDVLGTTTGVGSTTYTVPAAQLDGGAYYFKVAAANAGGESPGSVVVGARKPPTAGGTNRVLVVNGFDRFERTQDARQSVALVTGGTVATVDRVWARAGNSFDYVVQAGTAIAAYAGGVGFDSCQSADVAAGRVNLASYQTVVWLSGEESTADETFGSAEQSAVTAYLTQGGRLFASGAEIGWDLDRATGPTAADRSFYNSALKADYVSDDAGTYNVTAAAGSIFAGLAGFAFDNAAGATYDVDTPDVLTTVGGSTAALNYLGGTGGAAAVQYANPSNGSRVVTFGFPFEAISTAANRAAVLARVFDFLQTPVPPAGMTTSADAVYTITAPGGTGGPATLAVSAGTVTLGADAANTYPTLTVTVAGGATLALAAAQHLAGLSVADGGAVAFAPGPAPAARALVVGSLSVAAGGRVDLTNNALVVRYAAGQGPATLAAVTALVKSGYRGGDWGGPGLASSDAAADADRSLGLGVADNAAAGFASFAGESGLDGNQVLVRLTRYGDATLDGAVTVDDLSRLAQGYGQPGRGWAGGDFDYDGTTGIDDLSKLAQNYNAAAVGFAPAAGPALSAGGTSTPKPTPTPTPAVAVPKPAGPTLSVADASVAEGNAGQTRLTFVVLLSEPAARPVTVRYATADGTARAGDDYRATSGSLTFAAGQSTQSVVVTVRADRTKEAAETLFLNLSKATGATLVDGQGRGTVRNDD